MSRPSIAALIGPVKPVPESAHDLDDASEDELKVCQTQRCHYVVYVYSAGRTVDIDTLPFRRKQCVEFFRAQTVDEETEKLVSQLERLDKRLSCVELRSSCKIHLGRLHGVKSVVNGLPRRRLTIAGPTFAHIALALGMLEVMFPRLMSSAYYPYKLPARASLRYQSGNRMASTSTYYPCHEPSNIGLRAQLDDGPINKFKAMRTLCKRSAIRPPPQ
nr:unnamed protein product [Spirometra erinaceieuropaei]